MAGSGFRPLSNIPHCCPPKRVGPCLSPNVAVRPSRPAIDLSLGGLLSHQLANLPQVHLVPIEIFTKSWSHTVLPKISLHCPVEQGRSLRVTHPFAANNLGGCCSLDLHVLGLPPAFVLSQDQARIQITTCWWCISYPRLDTRMTQLACVLDTCACMSSGVSLYNKMCI